MKNNKIILFQGNKIRRIWHNDEWFFSILDIIQVLTGSLDPKQYIKRLQQSDPALNSKWGANTPCRWRHFKRLT